MSDVNSNRKKKTAVAETMIYGKVPPQAQETEKSILGALLTVKHTMDLVTDLLSPDVFYLESHQRIFKAMVKLYQVHQPIDIDTVMDELKKKDELEFIGGYHYLVTLTNNVVSNSHTEKHARIIYQKFVQRQLIITGGDLVNDGYSDGVDVWELLDSAEKKLFKVSAKMNARDYHDFGSLMVDTFKSISKNIGKPDQLSGVATGYRSFDRVTHGWQPSDLIILAARPAVGKTAFALKLARNAAMDPIKPTPVLFFSLEMSAGQLVQRIMSSESEVPLETIKRGRFTDIHDPQLAKLHSKSLQGLAEIPLYIDDTPSMTIFEMKAKARRLKNKYNIGMIIIDYLQLMSGPSNGGYKNREGEISEISRNLKVLAKELNIPVIALSQLSRETEKRSNKEPVLSDLRESGAIEQDADVVVFMYRPEYYEIHQDANGVSTAGITSFKFAKNRNGKIDKVSLQAHLWCQNFTEVPDDPFPTKPKEAKTKKGRNKDGITTLWTPPEEHPEEEIIQDKPF